MEILSKGISTEVVETKEEAPTKIVEKRIKKVDNTSANSVREKKVTKVVTKKPVVKKKIAVLKKSPKKVVAKKKK